MKKLFYFLVRLILIAGCQTQPLAGEVVNVSGGSYQNIGATELNTMLQNKDFLLINVHIPFAANIPHTDVSIPYNEIEQNLSEFPTEKNAKIALYCRSGRMSEIAADKLVSLGYTNVWNLQGGMVDWEQAGFELEN